MYGEILNAAGYYSPPYQEEIEGVEDTHTCEISILRYPESEMVHDKDNNCWVSKENLKEYLDICKGEMLWDDYQDLENKLLKQI